jgi:molybdopterin molybdotransferase
LETITSPLPSALNLVLAEDVIANTNLPRFDRSAVDGYAVKAIDTIDATQLEPRTLQISNEKTIDSKQTKQVSTGKPIPKGTDAVIMLEKIKQIRDKITIRNPTTPGQNISRTGEDVQKGEIAVEAGTRLKPQHLGLLSSLGIDTVNVFRKPKISILATGNELVELGRELGENQVFDVNRLVLSSLCRELGVEPLDLGIAKDDLCEIAAKLKSGLEKSDAVLTSGGTSVGGSDLVPDAIDRIGKPGTIVHGVAIRPAMPTALAIVLGKPVIILPGNPVAAMIGFEVFAIPLIGKLVGQKNVESRYSLKAKMSKGVATTLGRRSFVRVKVSKMDEEFLAEPISARGSSRISTMSRANGYVIVPENREGVQKGELVLVQLFDSIKRDDPHV